MFTLANARTDRFKKKKKDCKSGGHTGLITHTFNHIATMRNNVNVQ